MKKVLIILVSFILFIFLLGACDLGEEETTAEMVPSGNDDESWVIYWYLCGSDLESSDGSATGDLYELMDVSLPENVKFVIQTGGASGWFNDTVDPNYTQRYLYSSNGLELIDEQPLSNMGDPSTLSSFLSFCEENFSADKKALIFWNHGGGSVGGVSFDENFNFDSLTLSELDEAFHSVYEPDADQLPFDMIGFDTCLMATIDTAYTCSQFAHYLVASEEYEPGFGWYYTDWVQALADHPGIDAKQLGTIICDTYISECDVYGCADEATLSVTDLTKIEPLLKAYEAMGVEALTYAIDDTSFFGEFGRQASNTENYGGNTRAEGYTNMVDLGHLAANCSELLPNLSSEVLKYLKECVVYQVKGDYREYANGLSCYFSYNGDADDLHGFRTEGYSESFKYLFDYEIDGSLEDEGLAYVNSFGYEKEEVEEIEDLQLDVDKEYPVYLNDDGFAVLELEQDTLDLLSGVYFQIAYLSEEDDNMLLLGQDNDIVADWENGIFTDNFRNVWGAIDGHLVYMEVSEEAEEYTAYAVPILLNGEDYILRVIYDYEKEQFFIKGARKDMEECGMADKNLVQLSPGDEITTIHYVASISGTDDFEAVPVDSFTVTEKTSFDEIELNDGEFLMMFELKDIKNNSAYSQYIQLSSKNGDFDIEIIE